MFPVSLVRNKSISMTYEDFFGKKKRVNYVFFF